MRLIRRPRLQGRLCWAGRPRIPVAWREQSAESQCKQVRHPQQNSTALLSCSTVGKSRPRLHQPQLSLRASPSDRAGAVTTGEGCSTLTTPSLSISLGKQSPWCLVQRGPSAFRNCFSPPSTPGGGSWRPIVPMRTPRPREFKWPFWLLSVHFLLNFTERQKSASREGVGGTALQGRELKGGSELKVGGERPLQGPLPQCFPNSNVQVNPLGSLLKCHFTSGGLG